MLKKDNLKLGLLLGFLAPLLSVIIYYFYKFYPTFGIGDFFLFLGQNKTQISAISVPCLLLNIALFTIYINAHRDKTAKGIFVVTLIYAIASLALKFIL
ncbi:MAG: hypothetical protein JNL51_08420 [Chitinophagaceae bacterium]|nr:hypothetical protein [Chitinophagaceae bacterium]